MWGMAASWGLRVVVPICPLPSSCQCWLLPGRASPRGGLGVPCFWLRRCSAWCKHTEQPAAVLGVHSVGSTLWGPRCGSAPGAGSRGWELDSAHRWQRHLFSSDRGGQQTCVDGTWSLVHLIGIYHCLPTTALAGLTRFRVCEDTASRDPVEPT